MLGGLRHHGVPELFEFFELDAGLGKGLELYLAMEWIDGVSLQARLEEGPRLDPTEVMQLASDVLDVLIYLHGRSPPVFHRDIKPSNIVIRTDGTPVLIDFGGVCDGWRKASDSGDTIVGTTGYMPPEQYMGQVGPWSDLYALGATLLHDSRADRQLSTTSPVGDTRCPRTSRCRCGCDDSSTPCCARPRATDRRRRSRRVAS